MRSTHRMPFKTARRSFHGRPRPSLRRGGSGIRGSRIAHWRSVRSRALGRGIRIAPDNLLSMELFKTGLDIGTTSTLLKTTSFGEDRLRRR